LTRTPDHRELRRAFERFSRTTQQALAALVLRERNFDLLAALESDDPETLTSTQRRAVGQMMHDRGAAFMLSAR
jgi:hypothetical protein